MGGISVIAVPPFRAEFGIIIRYHVPQVAALPTPKVVMIEPGMEALYPDAEHVVVDRKADSPRRDRYRKDHVFVAQCEETLRRDYPGAQVVKPERDSGMPERRFVPTPFVAQGVMEPDVVICPRYRQVARERNWLGWTPLAERLFNLDLRMFAAGARETSDLTVEAWAKDAAWHYTRPLDAAIEAMRRAKLVIATDAGLAHLAVLCGRPLLIVAHGGGFPAPGLPTDEHGRVVRRKGYWKVRIEEYYEAANYLNAPILMAGHGWENVDDVVQMAQEMIGR